MKFVVKNINTLTAHERAEALRLLSENMGQEPMLSILLGQRLEKSEVIRLVREYYEQKIEYYSSLNGMISFVEEENKMVGCIIYFFHRNLPIGEGGSFPFFPPTRLPEAIMPKGEVLDLLYIRTKEYFDTHPSSYDPENTIEVCITCIEELYKTSGIFFEMTLAIAETNPQCKKILAAASSKGVYKILKIFGYEEIALVEYGKFQTTEGVHIFSSADVKGCSMHMIGREQLESKLKFALRLVELREKMCMSTFLGMSLLENFNLIKYFFSEVVPVLDVESTSYTQFGAFSNTVSMITYGALVSTFALSYSYFSFKISPKVALVALEKFSYYSMKLYISNQLTEDTHATDFAALFALDLTSKVVLNQLNKAAKLPFFAHTDLIKLSIFEYGLLYSTHKLLPEEIHTKELSTSTKIVTGTIDFIYASWVIKSMHFSNDFAYFCGFASNLNSLILLMSTISTVHMCVDLFVKSMSYYYDSPFGVLDNAITKVSELYKYWFTAAHIEETTWEKISSTKNGEKIPIAKIDIDESEYQIFFIKTEDDNNVQIDRTSIIISSSKEFKSIGEFGEFLGSHCVKKSQETEGMVIPTDCNDESSKQIICDSKIFEELEPPFCKNIILGQTYTMEEDECL